MTNLLIKIFVKNKDDVKNPYVRQRYGTLGSTTGIVANFLLFVAKFIIGTVSKSVSVTADSFNNLSDIGSSVVTLVGFKISKKPSDEKHPFGHGRMEYVSGLIVSFLILLVGFEFLKNSVSKIINPEPTSFTLPMIIIIALTIPVKIWLSYFNSKLGKIISSTAMKAASLDSLNDVLATGATLLSAIVSKYTSLQIDGYIGLLIALFVIYSGIGIAKETLNPLLGQVPDETTVKEIENRILSFDCICGIHDLIIHNYGATKCIASVHAEVPVDSDLLKIHDSIDLIEREIASEMDILITIHIDPIETDDEATAELKELITNIVTEVNPDFTIHDFRVVKGETHTNLIFDLVIPRNLKICQSNIKNEIDKRLTEIDNSYFTVIIFDRGYL